MSFDFPAGMIESGSLLYTRARDINDNGEIVGIYRIVGGNFAVEVRGFLLDKMGKFTKIDYPVGPPTQGENFYVNLPLGITNTGLVSGGYIFFNSATSPLVEHGFFRTRKGDYWTVDFPGAASTEIYKSSESGVFVGGFRDANGESNAFRARRPHIRTPPPVKVDAPPRPMKKWTSMKN